MIDFGTFSDQKLQVLPDQLLDTGLKSEPDAMYVGALIEEVDMKDIIDAMGRTDKTDMLNVYGNLLAGSENHLRSFVKTIEATTGEAYAANGFSGPRATGSGVSIDAHDAEIPGICLATWPASIFLESLRISA